MKFNFSYMLSFIFPILFFSSCAGFAYLIAKKIPQLAEISQESLTDQETFFKFLIRVFKMFFSVISPKRIRIYFLSNLAKFLNELRVWFLKLYHLIELMAKKARQESQKMEWEHHWFSSKDIEKDVKNGVEEARNNPVETADKQDNPPA